MTPNGQIWDPQGSFRWNSLDRPSGEVNVDIPLSLVLSLPGLSSRALVLQRVRARHVRHLRQNPLLLGRRQSIIV